MSKVPFIPAGGAFLFLLSIGPACGGGEENPFSVESEVVATAEQPVALAFAPDGRLFFTERTSGDIRVIGSDGQLQSEPFAHLDVASHIEWGLTGLAIDPEFETNHYVYAYFTKAVDPPPKITAKPVVTRFTDKDGHGIDQAIILEDLPSTFPDRPGLTTIGSIHFGPDGFLYLTIGDYDQGKQPGRNGQPVAQDLGIPLGKMLRVSKEEGAPASDNPFVGQSGVDPRIFAYGFYSPFDFAFHPQSGQIYGTDNTASCEELNLIKAGGNYGWPDVGDFPWPDCTAGTQIKGIHFFAKPETNPGEFLSVPAASGMEFVSEKVYPLLKDSLLVCESATKLMRRLILSAPNFDQVTNDDVVAKDCQFDVAVNPDGLVYYSNEHEIRRLVPVPVEAQ